MSGGAVLCLGCRVMDRRTVLHLVAIVLGSVLAGLAVFGDRQWVGLGIALAGVATVGLNAAQLGWRWGAERVLHGAEVIEVQLRKSQGQIIPSGDEEPAGS